MEIKNCPSCGSTEIEVAGNKVHCRACDVTFTITPQGAKVADLDPLGKDRERINKLEQELSDLKAKAYGKKNKTDDEDEIEAEEQGGIIRVEDDEPGAAGDEPGENAEDDKTGDEI